MVISLADYHKLIINTLSSPSPDPPQLPQIKGSAIDQLFNAGRDEAFSLTSPYFWGLPQRAKSAKPN